MAIQLQEKKYRVNSFDETKKILKRINAKSGEKVATTHYYTQHNGKDVIKLVVYSDKSEIHILKETAGKFSFKDRIKVKNKYVGLQWLKDKGYTTVDVVKMVNTDYVYKDGKIELYIINDFLHSVILYYPQSQHEVIEKELRLEHAEVINTPYNLYLKSLGSLRELDLVTSKDNNK